MTSIRKDHDPPMILYLRACLVVAHLAAALPRHQFARVSEQLHEAFEAFQNFQVREQSIYCLGGETLVICLPSLVMLARRDMGLVGSGALARIKDVLAGALQIFHIMEGDRTRQDFQKTMADLEKLHQELLDQ